MASPFPPPLPEIPSQALPSSAGCGFAPFITRALPCRLLFHRLKFEAGPCPALQGPWFVWCPRRCCQAHDCCYRRLREGRCSPLITPYSFTSSDGDITCSEYRAVGSSPAPPDTPSPEQGTQESIPWLNPAPFPAAGITKWALRMLAGWGGRAPGHAALSLPPRWLRPGRHRRAPCFPRCLQVMSRAGARERRACVTPRWPRASPAPCIPTTIPTASTSSSNAKEASSSAEEGESAHRVPDFGWFSPARKAWVGGSEKVEPLRLPVLLRVRRAHTPWMETHQFLERQTSFLFFVPSSTLDFISQ